MTIETYTDKYFLDVMRLVENFHKEAVGEYDGFDPQQVIETIKSQKVNANTAFLLIINDTCQGILYGCVFQSLTSGQEIFQEVIWYVNEPYRKYGIRLFKEVENRLKSKGISIIIMAVLENSKKDKLERFYKALGYKPMETHYSRRL